MEKHLDIGILMSQCLAFFEENAYSNASMRVYRSFWKQGIVAFMNDRKLTEYTQAIGEEFRHTYDSKDTMTPYEKRLICGVKVLDEMLVTGRVSYCGSSCIYHPLSGSVGAKMELFINHLKSLRRKERTTNPYRRYFSNFLNYLAEHGIRSVGSIEEHHIAGFLKTHMGPVRTNATSAMRMLFRFWHEKGIYPKDLGYFFKGFRKQKNEKIPSFYTKEEVLRIESSIDRASALGKRNYAMLLLASRLGLRAADIAGLTFESIDWEANVISLSMQKTGKEIELPLLAEVGNALIDYIKYGRRDAPYRNVFIRACVPYRPMKSGGVSYVIGDIILKSGVDTTYRHHGPHSLRHSLASSLLENCVPMPVISESLGHEYTTTTMRYLRIDLRSLMKCALPVPPVPEEFYTQEGGVFYE